MVGKVGNLGVYQWMTTTAKKVGGPTNFMIMLVSVGAILYKPCEIGVKKGVKTVRKFLGTKKRVSDGEMKEYKIVKQGISNEGVVFKSGDRFRVLAVDKEVVLIERLGDKNSPYFVSLNLVRNISDYAQ